MLPEGQIHTGEIEEELDALRDERINALKPTIALVVFSVRGQRLVLCTAKQDTGSESDNLYFPQGAIANNESIAEAAAARADEKLGIAERLVALHGLAGDVLQGTRSHHKRKLIRGILPVLCVTRDSCELHPYPKELATAEWYSLSDAHRFVEAQPFSIRNRRTREILARFDAWHTEPHHF